MPQEIYNEGRVVGLSAWEIFKRNAEASGIAPADIPDENKWLASMIGSGASMILRVGAGTTAGVHDYDLPLGSNLSAAGVIIASPFIGDCMWDSAIWATKVKSYGPTILNTSSSYPTSSTVPSDTTYSDAEYRNCVSEFVKITDGIVYTKGADWIQTPPTDPLPYKDIDPNFGNSTAVVRLYISADIDYDVKILLTGFTDSVILQSLSGHAVEESGYSRFGSADADHNDWVNGGMLGPEIFPWASKIIFTVPNSVYDILNSVTRTIPSDATVNNPAYNTTTKTLYGYTLKDFNDAKITSSSLVDFNSISLSDYYANHTFVKTPTLQESVSKVALGNGGTLNELVAWYPGMSATELSALQDSASYFPPALYGVQVSATGSQTMIPLDVAAPGTVKYFQDSDQAHNYKQLLPDNCSIYHNTTNNTLSFAVYNESNPANWPGTARLNMANAPEGQLFVGSQGTKFVALSNANGTDYDTSGTTAQPLTLGTTAISWDSMLTALSTGACIDVYGTRFRNFADEINNSNTVGVSSSATQIDEIGADKFTLSPNTTAEVEVTSELGSDGVKYATMDSGTTLAVGKNFIMFGNGLKLYISDTEPTDAAADIPIGSIGLGW